jgi:hypothetical protein
VVDFQHGSSYKKPHCSTSVDYYAQPPVWVYGEAMRGSVMLQITGIWICNANIDCNMTVPALNILADPLLTGFVT